MRDNARFGAAHVVERSAALSSGRLTVAEIDALADEFLQSELVVRLAPVEEAAQRKPPEWSTLEHRQIEDAVLSDLATLVDGADVGVDGPAVFDAIDSAAIALGDDQADAVAILCEPGSSVRVVLAPQGMARPP